MSIDLDILRYLDACRSTSGAVAQQFDMADGAALTVLVRLQKDGLAETSKTIPTTWKPTQQGRDRITPHY